MGLVMLFWKGVGCLVGAIVDFSFGVWEIFLDIGGLGIGFRDRDIEFLFSFGVLVRGK